MIATIVTVFLVASGLTLSGTTASGGQLLASDGWALVGVGLLLGAVALTPLRIRADADAHGIRVRNLVSDFDLPWSAVRSVRYQHGTPWASLLLHTDEVVTVLAVQISDGNRAVEAIRGLRSLHAAATQPADPS
ncbi:PH domain-containing protein [Actinoplanes sp. ATCC 53533]|uniref:PH domain-containing protein n=1 Tax=Actinoplanes sp. ATCC 53533 TaxID=1288362 RepID=UPI001F3E35CB|nr:PH domain-containing protein [Actinoplanes sp. ATCC 53533]